MRKRVYGLSLVALVAALAAPALAEARDYHVGAQVTLAPLGRSHSPPPLGRKQGWLTVSNRDWETYTLVVSGKDTLSLYRAGTGYGGMIIPSGATVTIALEKDTYDLYGNNPDKLKVKVREGRTTTLVLEPYGYVGRSGLLGVVNDGDKVRDGILFDTYTAPPVIVQPAPPVIVQPSRPIIVNRPPPPPPVIISRPPAHHRPPPPPPHRPGRPGGHGGKGDGWNVVFGFGSRR
jgi:hypothetical protein